MFTHHQEIFYLNSTLLKKVIQYVFHFPSEVSGYFVCTSDHQLNPVISFEEAGMNFVIPKNEKRTIFFHTHPKVCYDHYGSFCGLPSPADMVYLIHDYWDQKSIFNLVFAVEGIYTWQLTKSMMGLLSVLKHAQVSREIIDLIILMIKQTIHQSGFFQTFQRINVDQLHPFETPKEQYIVNSLEHTKYFQPILQKWFEMLNQLTIGIVIQEVAKHLSEIHKNTLLEFVNPFDLNQEKIYQFQYTSYLSFAEKEEHSIILDIVSETVK